MSSAHNIAALGFWGALSLSFVACGDDPASENQAGGGSGTASGGSSSGGATSTASGATGTGAAPASGGSSQGTAGTGAASTGGTPMAVDTCVSDGQLVITDDTNYSFSSTMTIQSTVVKDATDITFDWSQVTADMFGVQIDPLLDIDHVVISLWRMTETELADNMNKDNLPLGSNQGALTFFPNDAADHANLLEFDSFGNPVPEEDIWLRFDTSTPNYAYPPENHTWMMMVGSGDDATKGAQMLGFFKLDPASTNTVVALTNDSTNLDYTVDLQSIKQIPVPAGMAELSIDWSQMTTNALGNEYVGNQITNAVVAHYSMTLAELEEQFVFLEERSAQWWEADVPSGTSIALNTLEDETGSTFPGIDADGIWLVALRCTINCNNPAPWSITVLKPCP